jgi:hypothetical protein
MPAVEVICNDVRQTRRVAGVFEADEGTRETVLPAAFRRTIAIDEHLAAGSFSLIISIDLHPRPNMPAVAILSLPTW